MVLEDSCGAATASAEACDENPNCSAAAAARGSLKVPVEFAFVPDQERLLTHCSYPSSQERRAQITIAAR